MRTLRIMAAAFSLTSLPVIASTAAPVSAPPAAASPSAPAPETKATRRERGMALLNKAINLSTTAALLNASKFARKAKLDGQADHLGKAAKK